MIYRLGDKTPVIAPDAFVAESADVIGAVEIGPESSIWFGVVLRADNDIIRIGERSNIQDNSVVHVDEGIPTLIGSDVTIGHGALIHGCTIADGALVGNGAVVLDFAQIGPDCLVGANSLVTERKMFPPRSLILGSPARRVRELTDEEIAALRENVRGYIHKTHWYRSDLSTLT
ncbi:MAG: gamma carbonic anhydrase family protein [Arenicellales bacterium]|jgi:carbonic anhydrase/acetyltransferase-like protein (isoleucine patch superfamily)|nr:gamma carbonic anhydrase family protein [Arenicellales bacterium]HCV21517.1 gamma carbonic anhydrase family protein [Gammaproteobacteria bacterium]MDP7118952.1 gamma carbonic anhydrase family protein [Arenicellales bacterium]MDP7192002.1 gamma carbonic anhydrase family protein [Arenicellales bacterium]MDP7489544.1 gamma carbonic anhydrase family protein [Arenicellales bacterium]|tara:strand:- start:566 stop:1087 length:522 start_codon:yes stop_codon:yes gene_type:complete